MHSKPQQRLLAYRSPRYWLMSSVRLQPKEWFCLRMTLTLPLVGVGLQSKHVHLDQLLPAGGVITWGGLQSLKWTQLSKLRHNVAHNVALFTGCRKLLIFFFSFAAADFASFYLMLQPNMPYHAGGTWVNGLLLSLTVTCMPKRKWLSWCVSLNKVTTVTRIHEWCD